MNNIQSIAIVKEEIKKIIQITNEKFTIDEKTELVGNNSKIDSMKLVELCLSLEDRATELDFEFDWASENAMSKSKSIFRTVKSLAEEFQRQKNDQQ